MVSAQKKTVPWLNLAPAVTGMFYSVSANQRQPQYTYNVSQRRRQPRLTIIYLLNGGGVVLIIWDCVWHPRSTIPSAKKNVFISGDNEPRHRILPPRLKKMSLYREITSIDMCHHSIETRVYEQALCVYLNSGTHVER